MLIVPGDPVGLAVGLLPPPVDVALSDLVRSSCRSP